MHHRKQEWVGIRRRENMWEDGCFINMATAKCNGWLSWVGTILGEASHIESWSIERQRIKGDNIFSNSDLPLVKVFLHWILTPLYHQVTQSWALSRVYALVSQGNLLRWKGCWALAREGIATGPWEPPSPCRAAAGLGQADLEQGWVSLAARVPGGFPKRTWQDRKAWMNESYWCLLCWSATQRQGLLGGDVREAPAVKSPEPWKDNAFGFYPGNNELSSKQSL